MKVKIRRNKTTLRIFAMGAIAALVSIGLLSAAGGAAPVLSNSGGGSWTNYREISVTENSGSALTAYQVLVQLSGGNFPTGVKSDGADIRFTDANGNELSYWMESWDYAGKNAKIWVKIPSISASATATIRMYYGNPSAGSSSNGDTTFDFFDDFIGNSLDMNKWQINWGTWSVNNGYGSSTSHAGGGEQASLQTKTASFGSGYLISTKMRKVGSGNLNDWFVNQLYYMDANNFFGEYYHSDEGNIYPFEMVSGIRTTNEKYTTVGTAGTWFWIKTARMGNNIYAKAWNDGTTEPSAWQFSQVITGIPASGYIGYNPHWNNGGTVYVDFIDVRKYASSEPTLTLGAEQPVSTSDATLPTIFISSPSNGQSFTISTATISGTASDNIALSKIEVKVGAGSWQLASGTNSWSKEIVLSQGSNMVYARATDTSGNTAEVSIAVFYPAPDITTPAITTPAITTPAITTPAITTPPPPAVIPPCLTASHTTLKEEPEVGEEVLITVTIQNTCDGIAKNIRLSEQLPSSVSVSYIDGATSNTQNLVMWNGELAPNRAHAITHTLKILEKKSRAIPVIIRYEDEAGNQKESSTTIYVTAQEVPTTPVQTKAEPTPYTPVSTPRVTIPGFTGLLVLIGLIAAIAFVRRS